MELSKTNNNVVTRVQGKLFGPGRFGAVLTALLVFACWLPYLILLYPGAVGYDEAWAILQTFGSGSMSISAGGSEFSGHFAVDHKPIAHTLILGLSVHAGEVLGSQNAGLFSLVLLQSLFLAFAASAMIRYAARSGVRRGCWLILAFCCLFPAFPLSAACPANDVLFAGFFAFWMLAVFEAVRSGGVSLSDSKWVALLCLAGVGLVLFKKPGIYIVVATLLVFLVVLKGGRTRKALAVALISSLAAYAVAPLVVYPLLDVIPGGKQEMLAPLIQSTASYVSEHSDEVSESERAAIDRALVYDDLVRLYDASSQDPVKHCYRQGASSVDILAYAGVWIQQGLKHPDAYLRSWQGVVSGYVKHPAVFNYYDNTFFTRGTEGNIDHIFDVVAEGRDDVVARARESMSLSSPDWALEAQWSLRRFFEGMNGTVFAIPFCIPLYATWIPLVCFAATTARNRRIAWGYVPIVLSIAVLFISPIVSFRYALPLAFVAPLLIGVALWPKGSVGAAESRLPDC